MQNLILVCGGLSATCSAYTCLKFWFVVVCPPRAVLTHVLNFGLWWFVCHVQYLYVS
jgi:hypothetical protein